MKNQLLALLFTVSLFSAPAIAQQNSALENNERSDLVDEIIVTGTKQRDKAMSAYLSGDYATAEIEFDRNAFCALRASRNFRAGVDGAFDSTIRADVGTAADIPAQPTGGQGGATPTPTAPTVAPSVNINSSDFQKDGSIRPRTCEDRGFQLYMRGLSELKLGKISEAKESFTRAVVLRKSIYDAYFRLALLEYQDGDVKSAKKNFKRLRGLQKKCRKCESEAEIAEQVVYLENLLP